MGDEYNVRGVKRLSSMMTPLAVTNLTSGLFIYMGWAIIFSLIYRFLIAAPDRYKLCLGAKTPTDRNS